MAQLSDDPKEMARRCREQADETDDPRVVRFLLELADDYEELANAEPKDSYSRSR